MYWLRVFFAGSVGAIVATAATAQTQPRLPPKTAVTPTTGGQTDEVQARRNVLFEQMLGRPDDLDAAFEYASLSVQVGDLEAAISTLERMLIFAPGLPRLQLELGVLYYRLNALETARSYFESAISAPEVPAEVRSKVEQYLDAITQAQKPTRFAGQVRTGYRYQTNANRSPTDSIVILNGLPFSLAPAAVGSPDSNVYGAGVFHYSINLPSQGDTFEMDLVTYGTKQFERNDLNVALGELTFGPAFDLNRYGIDDAALGVYGILSTVFLNGHLYSGGVGAGTRIVAQPQPGLSWTAALEFRDRQYHDSSVAPTADERDGSELRGFTSVTYVYDPRLAFNGFAYAQHTDASAGYLAYNEFGISASPSIAFDSPIGEGDAWVFSPAAGIVWRQFEEPDPLIDADESEHDFETFVGAELLIPIKDDWGLLTETEYRFVDSNYTTRDYDNFSVSFSVVKAF